MIPAGSRPPSANAGHRSDPGALSAGGGRGPQVTGGLAAQEADGHGQNRHPPGRRPRRVATYY